MAKKELSLIYYGSSLWTAMVTFVKEKYLVSVYLIEGKQAVKTCK